VLLPVHGTGVAVTLQNTLGTNQSFTRALHAQLTPNLIARLGAKWNAAVNSGHVYALILQAVKDFNIAGLGDTIQDVMADNRKLTMDFIKKFRHPQVKGGTIQRHFFGKMLKGLFQVTELIPVHEQINFIKKRVFGIEDGRPIVPISDPIFQACIKVEKDINQQYVIFEDGKPRKTTCMGDLSQPYQREAFELIGNIIHKIHDITK